MSKNNSKQSANIEIAWGVNKPHKKKKTYHTRTHGYIQKPSTDYVAV